MSNYCPKCGSQEIVIFKKRRIQQCEDCQHEWKLTEFTSESTVSLSEAADEDVREFCRELARTAQWVTPVEDQWPAPIAHEYYQLKQFYGRLASLGRRCVGPTLFTTIACECHCPAISDSDWKKQTH